MARLGTTVVVALAACLLCCAAATAASAGGAEDLSVLRVAAPCDGTLGQCAVVAEEEEEVGGGLRRSMAQRQPTNRYISYAALRADQVPCNQRGKSYYTNCASQQKANPYRRGCSAITRCQRNTN
ncbi:hypothetical protein PR202_gb24611 [Eleusine coracana subsp. coracana]|uniref:Protein RALF-like 33 n=1 Tax=Eleusine coracana subsp. coracana TaxID=191504 RepID=A0AAV5FJG7_ELECO|nr:hypothetical protein QOZ80_5BG0450420 [Eleusine coracana subsp. coracana]GJN35804.1 hypothetical protein PR202_gb24611 [Eleusine coracana subsp. coracana]